jgi:predicted transcriptional regulator
MFYNRTYTRLVTSMLPEATEIKARRKALGLNQADLAYKAGLSRTSLVKLENGNVDLRYSKVKEIFDTLERESKNSKALFQNMTLKEIHHQPVEYLSVDDQLRYTSARMIETNFSQFPVKEQNKIVGSITEKEITLAISKYGEDAVSLSLNQIMAEPFPIISSNAKVSSIIELLGSVQAILTTEKDTVVGIVTNTDLYEKLV